MNAIILLIFFTIFSLCITPSFTCKCLEFSREDRICVNNFLGIVEIKDESTSCRQYYKCFDIEVLEAWKGSKKVSRLETITTYASCGVSFPIPDSGQFIVSGHYFNKSLVIGTCFYVFERILAETDPKVAAIKHIFKTCNTNTTKTVSSSQND